MAKKLPCSKRQHRNLGHSVRQIWTEGSELAHYTPLYVLSAALKGPPAIIAFSATHGWSAFGGPTMVGRTSDWKEGLGRFLKPFLDRLVTTRGDKCVHFTFGAGTIVAGISSNWGLSTDDQPRINEHAAIGGTHAS